MEEALPSDANASIASDKGEDIVETTTATTRELAPAIPLTTAEKVRVRL